jgi:hypothetical protein
MLEQLRARLFKRRGVESGGAKFILRTKQFRLKLGDVSISLDASLAGVLAVDRLRGAAVGKA